ncbi:unnamed protein product [Vitrella brassicaformis CCMP3155]|uniref:Uncharacterized protein n=1 Tax=Vitrella brassicaformis (strain CCMP3155) TaxID=1169540 RepID=A0A0G4GT68_VITBC|nr:unnamed protein product [Vitrella brassicaformis CCMP3155]|eukprot:CEM33887.1 unnamed protein product [Vitrella brassicaformis CCMP3155]
MAPLQRLKPALFMALAATTTLSEAFGPPLLRRHLSARRRHLSNVHANGGPEHVENPMGLTNTERQVSLNQRQTALSLSSRSRHNSIQPTAATSLHSLRRPTRHEPFPISMSLTEVHSRRQALANIAALFLPALLMTTAAIAADESQPGSPPSGSSSPDVTTGPSSVESEEERLKRKKQLQEEARGGGKKKSTSYFEDLAKERERQAGRRKGRLETVEDMCEVIGRGCGGV